MCFLEQVEEGLDSRDDIRVVDVFMRDFLYFFCEILEFLIVVFVLASLVDEYDYLVLKLILTLSVGH